MSLESRVGLNVINQCKRQRTHSVNGILKQIGVIIEANTIKTRIKCLDRGAVSE